MRRVTYLVWALSVLVAGVAGVAAASQPVLAIAIAAAVPLVAALIQRAMVRLIAVTGGALLVFQAPSSAAKFAYLCLAVLCFVLSAVRLYRTPEPVVVAFRPMVPAGAVFAVVIAVSGLTASAYDASLANWAADALPYVLLITLPIVGIDASADISPRASSWVLGSLGLLTAAGFAVDWLDRRGVSTLGVGRFILATAVLPALAFAYATVQCARGVRPLRWGALALAVAALLLVTGTRTNIVLAGAYLGLLGVSAKARFSPGRLLITGGSTIAGLAITLPVLGAFVLDDPAFLRGRLLAAISASRSQGTDQSYVIRRGIYAQARRQFEAHPWFGSGPGHLYQGGLFTLDTPWMVPAKFGIVGSLVLLAFLASVIYSVRRLRRLVGYRYAQTAARGWAVVVMLMTPFGSWPEDKGTALALMLCLAVVAADAGAAMAAGHHTDRAAAEGAESVDLERSLTDARA